ncbi:MAG: hypothetical protein IKE57_00410 [Oscillospiraceae bacterium]|nr:hypothetical protein [Oscillospiraceae bacterium]
MKKILALILALVMVLALVACGGGGNTPAPAESNSPAQESTAPASNSPAPSSSTAPVNPSAEVEVDTAKPYPHANADGTPDLDKIAHFDYEYDYTQNPQYRVAYVASSSYFLYQAAADAIEAWCPSFNLIWDGFYFNNDGDANTYITVLQQVLDSGVEMLIVDPDATIYPSVKQLIEQYPGVKWMPMMSQARDGSEEAGAPIGGWMVHPFVGFNGADVGRALVDKCWSWLQENYPDADPAKIGMISFDFSTSPALHERTVAAEEHWKEVAGAAADHFWICDTVSAGLNYEGAKSIFPGEVSKHSEIEYWLICGIIDDWGLAAADTLDEIGLTDTSVCVTFGGTGYIQQWDSGIHTAARFALFTAQTLYDEPILGAVYAFKNGWCTEEEIWPNWRNPADCGKNGEYSSLLLPTEWLTEDDYVHYLKWTDMYASVSTYSNLKGYADVPVEIDDYSSFVSEYPDYYTGTGM